jgi:hypothetical protein
MGRGGGIRCEGEPVQSVEEMAYYDDKIGLGYFTVVHWRLWINSLVNEDNY